MTRIINPETGRLISMTGRVYKRLVKKGKMASMDTRIINPKTNRAIKKGGKVYKSLIAIGYVLTGTKMVYMVEEQQVSSETHPDGSYLWNVFYPRNFIQPFKKYRMVYVCDDEVHVDIIVESTFGRSNYWSTGTYFVNGAAHDGPMYAFLYDSDESVFEHNKFEGTLYVIPETEVAPLAFTQSFAEGMTHCVFTPIREYFQTRLENSTSKDNVKKFNNRISKTHELQEKYSNGVPEQELESVCKQLNVSVDILDVVGNTTFQERPSGRPFKKFSFVNTRLNHVDILTSKDEAHKIEVSKDELFNMKKNLIESEEFFTFTNSQIHTEDGFYAVKKNEDMDEFESKIDNMKYMDNPEMSQFVRAGCHYGGTVNYDNDWAKKDIQHIDHKKSYMQWEQCYLYNQHKFPNAPKVYTSLPETHDYKKYPGYYLIDNIDKKNCTKNTRSHLKALGIYNTRDVYTVPELQFMEDIGITFKIQGGCFSYTTQDIKSAEFPMKDDSFHPDYKKWAGRMASIELDSVISFHGTSEHAQHLKSQYPDRVQVFSEYNTHLKLISVATRKRNVYHKSHISGYVLSYSRIQILQQLLEFKCTDVMRIQLDGIYFKTNAKFEPVGSFQNKEVNRRNASTCVKYISSYNKTEWNLPPYHPYLLFQQAIAAGEGGSGKTHHELSYPGYSKVLYVAPSLKLLDSKMKEFPNVQGCCYPTLLGEGAAPPIAPDVIVCDEATMLSDASKTTIIEMYPLSRIVFAGDMDETTIYQLPAFKGEPFDMSTFESQSIRVFQRTIHSRCQDDELYDILQHLRCLIKQGTPKHEINKWLQTKITRKTDYSPEDYIITGTHRRIEAINDIHHDKPNKWLITRSNDTIRAGEILIQDTQPNNSELRHAFTVHQVQGITVNTRLILDIPSFFAPQSAYTALSRARTLSQVYTI